MADSPKKEESSKKVTTPKKDTTSAPAAANTPTRPSGIPSADPSPNSDRRMVPFNDGEEPDTDQQHRPSPTPDVDDQPPSTKTFRVPDSSAEPSPNLDQGIVPFNDEEDPDQQQQPSAPSTERDEGGASTEQQQDTDQGVADSPPPGSSKTLSRSQKQKQKKKLKRKEKEAAAAASAEGAEEVKANLLVTPENKLPETPVDGSRDKEKAWGGEPPQLFLHKYRLVRKPKQAAAGASSEGGEEAKANLPVSPEKELPKTPVDSAKGIEKAGGAEDAKANLFVTPENKRSETPVDSLKGKEKAVEGKLGASSTPWHASGRRSLEDEGVYVSDSSPKSSLAWYS